MFRFVILSIAILCGLSCAHAESGTPAPNPRRVAVVVGVGAYQAVPPLANPPRDARAMAEALTRLGFDTTLVIDPDRAALEQAVRTLGDKSRTADAAVFFYAGHALEANGRNYIIPVGARLTSARDIPFETVDLDMVGQQVEGRARTVVMFMDSCRNNPFTTALSGRERGVRPGGGGLAAPSADASGTLIAFATAPGRTAEDGDGTDSPFTAALLKHIETPGLEVRSMMGRVRRDVREATEGKQVPWESSALEGDFYFSPAPRASQPAPVAAGSVAPPPASRPGDVASSEGTPMRGVPSAGESAAAPWQLPGAHVSPPPPSVASPAPSALSFGAPAVSEGRSSVSRYTDARRLESQVQASRCSVAPVDGMRMPGGAATMMNVANDGRGCSFRLYVQPEERLPFSEIVASTQPLNGALSVVNNSQIIYTPRAGFLGEDQFILSSVPRGSLVVRVTVRPPQPGQPG